MTTTVQPNMTTPAPLTTKKPAGVTGLTTGAASGFGQTFGAVRARELASTRADEEGASSLLEGRAQEVEHEEPETEAVEQDSEAAEESEETREQSAEAERKASQERSESESKRDRAKDDRAEAIRTEPVADTPGQSIRLDRAASDAARVALDHAANIDLASLASEELATRTVRPDTDQAVRASSIAPANRVRTKLADGSGPGRTTPDLAQRNGSPTGSQQETQAGAQSVAPKPTPDVPSPTREVPVETTIARTNESEVPPGGRSTRGAAAIVATSGAGIAAPQAQGSQSGAQALRSLSALGPLKTGSPRNVQNPQQTLHTPKPSPALAHVEKGLASLLKQSGGRATLRLDPHSLGTVRADVEFSQGTASVTLRPQTEVARALLMHDLDALRRSLEASGVRVERLTVEPVERTDLAHHVARGQETHAGDTDGSEINDRNGRSPGGEQSADPGGKDARHGSASGGAHDGQHEDAGVGDTAPESERSDAAGVAIGLDTVI